MEKNKNRTDLLAAGRKKFQQFRQKKDGKGGGQGKSSKKSNKSEQHESDVDVASGSANLGLSSLPEGEGASSVGSDLRVVDSSSKENSMVPEIDVAAVDSSSVRITFDPDRVETSLVHDAELPTQEPGVGDVASLVPNEGERIQNIDAEEERVMSSATTGIPLLDGKIKGADISVVADLSMPSTSNDTAKVGIVTVLRGNENGKLRLESMPLQEVVPDASLIQERGYQEADGSGLKQYNRSGELQIEEDEKSISPKVGGSDATVEESASGGAAAHGTTHEEKESNVGEMPASMDAANMLDGSASAVIDLHEAGATSTVCLQMTNHLTDEVAVLPNEGPSYILPTSGNDLYKGVQTDLKNMMVAEVGNQQYMPEGCLMAQGKTQGTPLEKEMATSSVVTVYSLGDGCSISLSQLKEIVRELGEDEFKSILNSRGSVLDAELGSNSLILPKYGDQDSFERLKEELYLTNFIKDVFHLQLVEMSDLQMQFDHQHHQSVDEISLLRASLSEVQVKKECLAEELAHCRSELQAVSIRREELEDLVHSVKAEAQELSARAHELQINLERSLGDLSSLSMELADCKGLVASLQVENENLNGTLASVTEDRRKLVVEKEFSVHETEKLSLELTNCRSLIAAVQVENLNLSQTLALMTEEKKKLEEEKESLVGENEKMSMEWDENAELKGNLALVTEERKKLEEENKSLVGENEKMSISLIDSKSLVAALQGENAELNGTLSLVKEMKKRLEEERESLAFEIEKISAELADCKCLVAALQGENANLNESLALSIEERKKLEGDKEFFVRENVRLSNELLVSQKKFVMENGECMQDGGISSPMLEKPSSGGPAAGPSLELQEVIDDSSALAVSKRNLEEAEKILQNLEEDIERMLFESTSFNKSGGKLPSPGVSTLIQAFESKVQHDESETEDKGVTEDPPLADPFKLIKEQLEKLRGVMQQLYLDAENAKEKLRKISNVTLRKLKLENEALEDHSGNLEATNIELGVLYEAVRQHACGVEAKNYELQHLLEDLKQQDLTLKAECLKASEKERENQSRLSELLTQLHDLQQSLNEKTLMLECQVESLQKEASERTLMVEQEWKSTITQIIKTVERLDKYSGRISTLPVSANNDGSSDGNGWIAASINSTIKVIEDLQEKLETSHLDNERVNSSYKEVNERFNDLLKKNELASVTLHTIYDDLRKLVTIACGSIDYEPQVNIEDPVLSDPIDYIKYKTIFEKLEKILTEGLQLQSVNNELKSELISKTNDIEEFNKRCLDSNGIQKLIEEVESVVKLENAETDLDKMPLSHLELLLSTLVQKYIEAGEQASSSRKEFGSLVMELTEMQEMTYQLSALNLQYETQIIVLKASLRQVEEALVDAHSELQEKVCELEQSDKRVSSIREKLSVAVSKGKGLVVQRDSLKKSLAETSKELERCSQELQLRDTRLYELETKLKTYMEAGERVEALESELSYIRNSATALRESFLLKDSVLQRIEEILEDLDLPEQFHSRDIIEKVDWLVRSATSNSLPIVDWDQKSMGGSYSDAGFVVTDGWKEDPPPSSSSGDDVRRKYEELQSKFYGLAEQNEMLEQSLMERNRLLQRWEGLLNRINMPAHLRSMEPEDRMEWIATALVDANHDRSSLQQKIENLEDYCRSVTADFEESQKRIYELEADIQAVIQEREHLSEKVETLTRDHEKILAQVVHFELEKATLQSEMTGLQEQLENKGGIEERFRSILGEISRLEDLVSDALQDSGAKELVSGESNTERVEILLRKLIEQYSTLSVNKAILGDGVDEHCTKGADANLDESRSRDVVIFEEPDVAGLKKDLEDALLNLMHVKEERDTYMEKQQSLIGEVAALDEKREELQELLTQEEQKSASLREKLNVAVRKGKSLVQQRDSLKQTLEEMTNKLERLKSEISHRENALAGYEQKIRDLSAYPEMVEALESERSFLRNRLMEAEHLLQEREHMLSVTMHALGGIDVGGEVSISDPVEKLEQIGKQFHDLHASLASSEQETRKSRRAADLLLAELNEVQERNDVLQEELAKAATELSEVYKERDEAEAAKVEVLSHLERLSKVFSEGKQKQYSELTVLKSGVTELKKGFLDISSLVADIFSKDLEVLHHLEAYMESHLKQGDANNVVSMPILSAYGGNSGEKENLQFMDSWSDPKMPDKMPDHIDDSVISEVSNSVGITLQELENGISALREKLWRQLKLLHDKAIDVFKLTEILCGEMTSQKRSFDALKRDITRMVSIEQEKDANIFVLSRNIALLYEACANSIMEIENRKAELVGDNVVAGHMGMNLNPATIIDGGIPFGGQTHLSSEEFVKSIADKLSSTLKDFAITKTEGVEDKLKEMKITITNMQRELQEKDIQKERICTELVCQIKEAEAAARNYSLDLQLAQTQMHDMEQQLKVMEEERSLLEKRLKELQDEQATLIESKDRVRSLSDVLAAKDQEIEALMQALDEEEIEVEEMKNKLEELEKVVQRKNLDLETLEASRGKIAKRLSVTVSKFDELHHMSETLLGEVEKLQSQLQDRDAEISFLRQEVTRCTNDALIASQMSSKRDLNEIEELLTWFDTITSQVRVQDVHLDSEESIQVHNCREVLQKKISAIISEFEDLRIVAKSREALLEEERNKVQELSRREEILQKSLHEKELQISLLDGVGDSGRATSLNSEILEVERLINKRTTPGASSTSQVRSLRKVNNNDQVAIAIDMEPGGNGGRLEDDDDDKVHGFKSLTTSRIVPKFTRPATDMIDGLWVSCDRALMRQPALRLGIIVYWAVLHTLLASFVF